MRSRVFVIFSGYETEIMDHTTYLACCMIKSYHHERIHQSLGRIIEPKHNIDKNAEIQYIERLGGLLKSYHRLAA